jgi:hypothetical protein
MELHEFIAKTLNEIQQGVQKAIDNTITKGIMGSN